MKKTQTMERTVFSWDEETSALVDWFLTADLPKEPFRLSCGEEVTDPESLYGSLQNDIAQGTEGARARSGTLQEDLQNLFDLFENDQKPETPR